MNTFSNVNLRLGSHHGIFIFLDTQSKINLFTGTVVSYYIKKYVYGLDGRRIIQNGNGEAFCSTIAGRVRQCMNASSARVTSYTFFFLFR